MPLASILTIAGALCGTLGSILTAFSVNRVLGELHLAQGLLNTTAEALAHPQSDVPIFTGLDKRFSQASAHSSRVIWFGVVLLALGFILQTASNLLTAYASGDA